MELPKEIYDKIGSFLNAESRQILLRDDSEYIYKMTDVSDVENNTKYKYLYFNDKSRDKFQTHLYVKKVMIDKVNNLLRIEKILNKCPNITELEIKIKEFDKRDELFKLISLTSRKLNILKITDTETDETINFDLENLIHFNNLIEFELLAEHRFRYIGYINLSLPTSLIRFRCKSPIFCIISSSDYSELDFFQCEVDSLLLDINEHKIRYFIVSRGNEFFQIFEDKNIEIRDDFFIGMKYVEIDAFGYEPYTFKFNNIDKLLLKGCGLKVENNIHELFQGCKEYKIVDVDFRMSFFKN